MAPEILVIENQTASLPPLCAVLQRHGYAAHSVSGADDAVALVGERAFDAVITDMPVGTGWLSLCEQLRALRPDLPIVATGRGDVESVLAALRSGAYDYVVDSVPSSILLAAVTRAVEYRRLLAAVQRSRAAPHLESEPLIGDSPAIRAVKDILLQVADSDVTVLITGESGTGKERAARALHGLGPRRANPFVAMSSAAIPSELLESELFGHVQGAFTGAIRTRPGLLANAERGTIFLDEIGDMPLGLQGKLLRALQERRFRPVGDDVEVPLQARVIAATHRDLERDVPAGRFRQELYYRINVVQIAIPPLRERNEDILPLALHVLQRVASRIGKGVDSISPAAAQRLLEYDWPGNVRQLENCIERAVLLTRYSEIGVDDLAERVRDHHHRSADSSHDDLVSLAEMKRRYLTKVVQTVRGNKSRAARLLNIDRRTLCKHLRDAPATRPLGDDLAGAALDDDHDVDADLRADAES